MFRHLDVYTDLINVNLDVGSDYKRPKVVKGEMSEGGAGDTINKALPETAFSTCIPSILAPKIEPQFLIGSTNFPNRKGCEEIGPEKSMQCAVAWG